MNQLLSRFRIVDELEVLVAAGPGARREVGGLLAKTAGYAGGKVGLVVDGGVPAAWRSDVASSLASKGIVFSVYEAGGGEEAKSISAVTRMWKWMISEDMTRDSFLLVMGGGAVSDAAGFAAATYMRGINWGVIPTTLLAMADASLGGKTGVNFEAKNIIGAFHHPSLIVADTELALTLSERDYVSGLAEVVKHAVIAGYEKLEMIRNRIDRILARDPGTLSEIVAMSIETKMGIVSRDYRERRGLRTILNLGHTFAHAVERASNYSILHGHAVAIGLNVEMIVAEKLLDYPRDQRLLVAQLLERLKLPIKPPSTIGCSEAVSYIRLDKKRRGDSLVIPLPRRIGRIELVELGLDDARRLLEDACRSAMAEELLGGVNEGV